jgi:hypothetical protein
MRVTTVLCGEPRGPVRRDRRLSISRSAWPLRPAVRGTEDSNRPSSSGESVSHTDQAAAGREPRRVKLASLGKDADDIGPSLDLLIQPLQWVGAVELGAVLGWAGHVGQHVVYAVVHQDGELWPTRSQLVGNVLPGHYASNARGSVARQGRGRRPEHLPALPQGYRSG